MEPRKKYDIFISYKRQGGAERAELLKAVLEKNGYQSGRIFMDTHSLKGGDFTSRLKEAVAESSNFIVLVTKGCFDGLKENDYWVCEISEALRLNKNIIPVFFDGIKEIDQTGVPEVIKNLSFQNAVSYNHEYADASYQKLCSFLANNSSNRRKEDPEKTTSSLKKNRTFYYSIATLILVLVAIGFFFFQKGGNVQSNQEPLETNKDVIAHVQDATIMVLSNASSATAFLVSDSGLALTANHILNHANMNDQYVVIDGERYEIKSIVSENPQLDYTLFQIDTADKTRTFPYLKIASTSPTIGEEVSLSSYDYFTDGCPPILTKGNVTSIVKEKRRIQTSTSIQSGMSGSPLCNASGEAVGLALAIKENNDHVIYTVALDLSVIHSLVEAQGDILDVLK